MAFAFNQLQAMVPAPAGARTFRYWTNDAQAAVDTYFDSADAAPYLTQGDVLMIVWDVDGTPIGEMAVVTASDGVSAVTCGIFDVLGS